MASSTSNGSCTPGKANPAKRRLEEAAGGDPELVKVLEELDSTFQPTERQQDFMLNLCDHLGLDFATTVAGLTSHELYSAKLNELKRLRSERNITSAEEATPGQVNYLGMLGVSNADIANLTKATASEKIAELVQERENRAPTDAQLRLLELNYHGSTPNTRNRASEIIKWIRLDHRIQYLRQRAARRGHAPATIERLVALVRQYGL